MIDLDGMRVFVAVAETGSLTAAGKKLDLPKSTVSRRLRAYESAVATTLFRRSTSSISLTDSGKRHFARVRALVHEAEEAVGELVEQSREVTGLVRISASLGIGERILAPLVWGFVRDHPKVRVELVLTDERVDLVSDGIDFTIRMGELEDSDLLVKRLGQTQRVLVAAPACIERHFSPRAIADLRLLPAIVTTPENNLWRFASGEVVRVSWRIAAGTNPAVLGACLYGHGIALLPKQMVRHHLAAGKLVRVLEHDPLPEVSMAVVYPRLRHQTAAAQAFLKASSEMRIV